MAPGGLRALLGKGRHVLRLIFRSTGPNRAATAAASAERDRAELQLVKSLHTTQSATDALRGVLDEVIADQEDMRRKLNRE